MKVIIYTCNIGGYDKHWPTSVDANCIYLTSLDVNVSGWFTKRVPIEYGAVKTARYWKINSHLLECDISIWVDSSFKVVAYPKVLASSQGQVNCFPHGTPRNSNSSAYEEASVCQSSGLDDFDVIRRQVERYRSDGFPDNQPLYSTGIIVRKHTPEVKRFNEAWWEEVERGSCRDQISQTYAAWKTGMIITPLQGCVYSSTYFKKHSHHAKRRTNG